MVMGLSVKEISMVDFAYHILQQRHEPMQYRDLMREIAQQKEMDEEIVRHYLPQLYTEINIDGRFICVGRGMWGLRSWYPTEQATDSAVAANVKDDLLLDEDMEELGEPEIFADNGEDPAFVANPANASFTGKLHKNGDSENDEDDILEESDNERD